MSLMSRVLRGAPRERGSDLTRGAALAPSRPAQDTAAPLGKPSAYPLCVDLDGTLLRIDTLHEQLLLAAARWRCVRQLPAWLRRGRAYLKQQLARAVPLDVAALPYNEALIKHLRQQRVLGRRLVLATAADQRVANAINAHLHLFDEVIASDGVQNLRGRAKAARLAARFGERGFSYVGSGLADLAVWRRAASGVVTNARRAIARAARAATAVECEIGRARSRLAALWAGLRPHQWSKNLLVFVPVLTSGAIGDGHGWLAALTMFAAFCFAASGIYLVNDLTDLAADRRHPRKRLRPFASGDLPVVYGIAAAPLLIAAGGALALRCGGALVLAAYVVLSVLYSLTLKEKPLADIFALAALYSIRLFGGGIASGHPVSLWLLMFSSFMFFSLACIKRVAELRPSRGEGKRRLRRRGYAARDLETLEIMGIGATFVSSMVLGLYVQGVETTGGQWSHPEWLWAMIPLLLFWQLRLWLSTTRGYMLDDPIVYASQDWVSQAIAVLSVVVYFFAVTGF